MEIFKKYFKLTLKKAFSTKTKKVMMKKSFSVFLEKKSEGWVNSFCFIKNIEPNLLNLF